MAIASLRPIGVRTSDRRPYQMYAFDRRPYVRSTAVRPIDGRIKCTRSIGGRTSDRRPYVRSTAVSNVPTRSIGGRIRSIDGRIKCTRSSGGRTSDRRPYVRSTAVSNVRVRSAAVRPIGGRTSDRRPYQMYAFDRRPYVRSTAVRPIDGRIKCTRSIGGPYVRSTAVRPIDGRTSDRRPYQIIIIIIINFYSPVSNTRCHSIGHKMRIARIKIRVDSPGRWERNVEEMYLRVRSEAVYVRSTAVSNVRVRAAARLDDTYHTYFIRLQINGVNFVKNIN